MAEKQDAPEFGQDDEEIVVALAAAAGVGLGNARLYANGGWPPPPGGVPTGS